MSVQGHLKKSYFLTDLEGPQSVAVLCQFLLFCVYSVSSQMRNHRGSPEIINSGQPNSAFSHFSYKEQTSGLHTFGYFITVKAGL